MTSRRAAKLLFDAVEAVRLVGAFVGARPFEAYCQDAMVRAAVERELIILGEALGALRRIRPELAEQVPELARIVAFRNILVHGYDQLDDAIVWEAATVKLPALGPILARMLRSETTSDTPQAP
jgi:uncharacterized protein with HEPN domain